MEAVANLPGSPRDFQTALAVFDKPMIYYPLGVLMLAGDYSLKVHGPRLVEVMRTCVVTS